jgi:hypothetical protein
MQFFHPDASCFPVAINISSNSKCKGYSGTLSASPLDVTWGCASGTLRGLYSEKQASPRMAGIIAPTGAASVTLTFMYSSTNLMSGKLNIYSCTKSNCSTKTLVQLMQGQNTEIIPILQNRPTVPDPVSSYTGIMMLEWYPDTYARWEATWISQRRSGE